MTSEERDKMLVLCKLIQDEKDSVKLFDLVEELNKLLDQKSERIQPRSSALLFT